MRAGLAAGCQAVLVLTGRRQEQVQHLTLAERSLVHVAADLAAAARWILTGESRRHRA